jgi:beta-1,4-N-acetylglucosaminyltransferase
MKLTFVTVGTTRFDEMVSAILNPEFLDILIHKGYDRLVMQVGSSVMPDITFLQRVGAEYEFNGLQISIYTFKGSLESDLKEADLVISHAGAGSILETIDQKKPCIVCVNESLMDNHQRELANKLSEMGVIAKSTPRSLREILVSFDHCKLQLLEKNRQSPFPDLLETTLGFK